MLSLSLHGSFIDDSAFHAGQHGEWGSDELAVNYTPIVKLSGLDVGRSELFLKLENTNPTGSIKDRIALLMIEAAEQGGRLLPSATVIEASSGNTGISLAMVCRARGLPLIVVVPEKVSLEKVRMMRKLGAEVRITRADVGRTHPEYYENVAQRLASEVRGGYFIDQFANPANVAAHEHGTAPEIWHQMNGAVDAIVCGVGSGGTLTGLYRYFARVQPELEIVLADPAGSVLAQHVRGGRRESWHASVVEGIGCDSIPPLADLSGVNQAITVEDYESLGVVRELFLRCGILAGPSTGTLVAAAIRYCRQQHWPKRVLTFACDDGARYLSKVFDDSWLSTHGFSQLSDPRPAPDLEHLRRC